MIKEVSVIGIGSIGRSIVLAAALAGYKVLLVSRRGLEAYTDFNSYLKLEVKKGHISSNILDITSRLNWTNSLDEAAKTDLVVETVIENVDVKSQILSRIAENSSNHTILATNTSSLSINMLAKAISKPERFIGLHFFNPAHLMNLIEVIPAAQTSKETVEASLNFVHSLNKVPIEVPDTPGFIVNNVLFPMINQAIFCMMNLSIGAERVDECLKLGANLPMGPLALADFIGLDTCLSVLENLFSRTNDPIYQPHQLLRKMVLNGDLGRKTQKGFFEYKNTNCRANYQPCKGDFDKRS